MRFNIYPDKSGKSRWRLIANNGKIVADSGEAYHNPGNARRAIKSWVKEAQAAPIIVVPAATPDAEL